MEGRTFILEDTEQNPRLRRFSGEQEAIHMIVKEWIPEASQVVPVTPPEEEPVLEAPGERQEQANDSRANKAGLHYTAKQYQQGDTVETRDDFHYEVRPAESHHQTSILGNRFTSTDIDPEDTVSSDDDDSGVEVEDDNFDNEDNSNKDTHGFFRNMLAVFQYRSSRRSLDASNEGSFDEDSESDKAPPPEMETVQFFNNSLEATSTISESTDGDSNASNLNSDDDADDDEEEEQDDDLFEDGLFEDGQEYWNDRMMCICSCK